MKVRNLEFFGTLMADDQELGTVAVREVDVSRAGLLLFREGWKKAPEGTRCVWIPKLEKRIVESTRP
ncbi:hypothetical protein C8P63_10896 [Melghirimyces profundicolus]|uniref:Uncharacterized protein n=1 Tax=Melghirimyces profundicolus TaxID=1242148 RepID=A0A2T6BXM8_9BACL|nr:hypothetical protein [Melghirimyces profundicolus]PTX60786.1 hypothetical protein C8P63_10896 [Melghirimyces profundicolus]